MGVSASIYFRVREGSDLDVDAIPFNDRYCTLVDANPNDAPPTATHKLKNEWRWYDETYNRGWWPDIAVALMILLATPDVETVWYGPDTISPLGDDHVITPERVAGLNLHFMRHGAWSWPVTNNTPDQAGA